MSPKEFRVKRSELGSFRAQLKTGEPCTIVLLDSAAKFVEIGDSYFRRMSGVLLPAPPSSSPEDPLKPGLALIAGCLTYASKNPERRLLIVGHTDAAGDEKANVRLSSVRSEAVHGLLVGDREQFARACHGPHLTDEQRYPDGGSGKKKGALWDDYADVLSWLSLKFGWPCSYPKGNASLWNATVAFQKSYNKSPIGGAAKTSIPESGWFDLKTWGAVYDCYQSKLALALGVDEAGLASLRGKIVFLNPSAAKHLTGCGGYKPVTDQERSLYASQTNLRVDVTFFQEGDDPGLPCMSGSCVPASCRLEKIDRLPIATPWTDSNVKSTMARLIGAYFDTNKCFLLPNAMPTLKKLVDLYKAAGVGQQYTGLGSATAGSGAAKEMLIVGHTDTSGTPDFNQTLSEERAASMAAFLKNDVEAWLGWFGSGVSDSKRWGKREEQLMMLALIPPADWEDKDLITVFQTWHNDRDSKTGLMNRPLPPGWCALSANGEMNADTRRQLIIDYMDVDGTTLSKDVPITIVGCGERYPLKEVDGELQQQAKDGEHKQFDRRVEIFFFEQPPGIDPPAPTPKESGQYPMWRAQSAKDQTLDPLRQNRVELRIHNRQLEPMADEVVVFKFPGDWAVGVADEAGLMEVPGPDPHVCVETTIYWGSKGDLWDPRHAQEVLFNCGEGDGKERDWSRLHNLGFHTDFPENIRLSQFQRAYGLPFESTDAAGQPPGEVASELKSIWNERKGIATPSKSG
jgi:outer membrane protein OmpA-like peptidoglycan-associated protein